MAARNPFLIAGKEDPVLPDFMIWRGAASKRQARLLLIFDPASARRGDPQGGPPFPIGVVEKRLRED
jgi:hypothetical protein